MGTPDFAVPTLEKIYNEGYDIPLVITQPDRPKGRGKKLSSPPVKIKAKELGLDVYQPQNVNDKECITQLEKISPDVIVVIAYGQILKEDLLNLPKYGCVNVHASLLPKYRGAAPINWVIINGEKKTGITTMYMDKGLDSGDILLKEGIDIREDETAGELHDRLMYLGADVLVETLRKIENGTLERIPQDHDKATYAPMMDRKLGKIDWEKSAEKIKNLVRGTYPWPGAYTNYKGKKVKIIEVDAIDQFKEGEPGKVVKVSDEGIYVNAKEGCIVIKRLQFPNKRKMTIRQYLLGNSFEEDVILQ
ncbi:methionyl-tRNA formyltransferase [Thermohalobacter berrensis]|uniref:Methionyl-tRNA formyltransferase n=2 Tax=Thermohalobacter berrensis TaxID=99594 RepID=A0A419TB98_9FIRM|nr:methionyl-tRNA formyltransferase [Thermohalobacter berrensis]